ncbi:hypothetical protein IU485_08760 [Nocardia cyriacigeorgica]|uniref:hypothetical protein n=1 Tax=Nocardia cyriacigeorgica TaxID=135487 RepID=UPI0018949679|nr:hypothetical protein [Nocardia cyriacigeorgica]MBF6081444.1 hypothetical protein [Nocardia cyriacigeorgica]MBF6090891.1 hypothetical protein [Nocardia cyriacigeorgica]
MSLKECAQRLGIPVRRLSKFALRNPGVVPRDRSGRYVLSEELLPTLAQHLTHDTEAGVDAPGLPLEALSDPAMREAFTRLRFERERRLIALIRRA